MAMLAVRTRLAVWARGLPVPSQIALALGLVAAATVLAWLGGFMFGHVVGAIVRAVSARFGLERAIQ